jgi:hypothetical protein
MEAGEVCIPSLEDYSDVDSTNRVNQRFLSIDSLVLARLDKSPRGGAKK